MINKSRDFVIPVLGSLLKMMITLFYSVNLDGSEYEIFIKVLIFMTIILYSYAHMIKLF